MTPNDLDSTAPKAMACVFQTNALTKEYHEGQVRALRGVDFTMPAREFVALVGTSGSGKTTMLQMLGALDTPTSGTVLYRGDPISKLNASDYRAREIGFVFQAFHLLPTFTAQENVQIPMLGVCRSVSKRKETAVALLKAVGLGDRLHHYPHKLSGGEKQRVAIARSLANEPAVLLADEPTGNLDSENAAEVMDLLKRLHSERAMSTIIVTHDMDIAGYASRIVRMRDGRIVGEDSNNDAENKDAKKRS